MDFTYLYNFTYDLASSGPLGFLLSCFLLALVLSFISLILRGLFYDIKRFFSNIKNKNLE